jgi:hypothetical protein
MARRQTAGEDKAAVWGVGVESAPDYHAIAVGVAAELAGANSR